MSKPICPNPEDCCRELSRVWDALGVSSYTGKSASEHVRELAARHPVPLRDYFAAKAMLHLDALLISLISSRWAAWIAYQRADAMLAERAK